MTSFIVFNDNAFNLYPIITHYTAPLEFPYTPQVDLPSSGNTPLLSYEFPKLYPQEHNTLDPFQFRHPLETKPYEFPQLGSLPEFSNEEELNLLQLFQQCCGCNFSTFNPQWDLEHPIHVQIIQLCDYLLSKHANASLEIKIAHFENAVAELTRAGTNNMIKAELIEIALRKHFSSGLVNSENIQIKTFFKQTKKLPDNLIERETALFNFATNEGFYSTLNLNISHLLDDISPSIIKSCLNKVKKLKGLSLDKALQKCEIAIFDTFREFHLNFYNRLNPSPNAWAIEKEMRIEFTRIIIGELATHYADQFQSTGAVNRERMLINSEKLADFCSNSGKFPLVNPPKIQLFIAAFDLSLEQQPFIQAKAKVEAQKNIDLQATKGKWFHSSRKKKLQEIERKSTQQMKTLDWAEKIWEEHYFPLKTYQYNTFASAPTEQQNLPIIKVPLPKFRSLSYVNIAFTDVLQKGASDKQILSSLPPIIQRDVLNHVMYLVELDGIAEDAARRIYAKKSRKILKQMDQLNDSIKQSRLDNALKIEAENLLDFRYSSKIVNNWFIFIERFRALPITQESVFLQYVHEIALASKVPMEADPRWAEFNWFKPEYLQISILALERYLHVG